MCGIAGLFQTDGAVDSKILTKMGDALLHRGPDGFGVYTAKRMGMIHRRLSILDVEGGAQPLASDDGAIQVIANGEIYNYKQLQEDVKGFGHPCKTGSDCEVLVGLYAQYGLGFTKHIEGMYSSAIYDAENDRLILSRDPLGIKQLYYAQVTEGFIFASEPAAIVASGLLETYPNRNALAGVLNRQFSTDTDTMFEGVYRLRPGETLVVRDGVITHRQMHRLTFAAPRNYAKVDHALEELEDNLFASVERHIQSDVPYGVFLSGGIDSSALVHAMKAIGADMRSYTIGFASETVSDERQRAESLADRLGTEHTSVLFDEDDFWTYLPIMFQTMDDVVADYAILPVLKLAERASQDVKVILSGEGGDEVLAGYGRYRPNFAKRLLNKPLRGRGDVTASPELFMQDFMRNWKDRGVKDPLPRTTALQKRQLEDIQGWLPDDLLLKADRALMRYSLEGRVPYLDDTFAMWAFGVPDELKVQGKTGKWLLKEWLHRRDPECGVWEKKRGFTVPIAHWLYEGRDTVKNFLIGHTALDEWVDDHDLEKLLNNPLNNKQAKLIFNLMCYAGWYQTHIQGKTVALRK